MKNYIQNWYDKLNSRTSIRIKHTSVVEGISDKHLGPRIEYAKVVFECTPSDEFEVDFGKFQSRTNEFELLFLEAAISGFIDIAMLNEPHPLRCVHLKIVHVDFDEMNASEIAFRHAGQDAAKKVLESMKFN